MGELLLRETAYHSRGERGLLECTRYSQSGSEWGFRSFGHDSGVDRDMGGNGEDFFEKIVDVEKDWCVEHVACDFGLSSRELKVLIVRIRTASLDHESYADDS